MSKLLTAAEARHRDYRDMTEAELLANVMQIAHTHQWLCAHFRPAQTARGWRTPVQGDGAGFPDLVLARACVVLFRELKRTGETPTQAQQAWLNAVDGDVWYPADLESGEIERQLT